jgi:nucleotide-binding universal stress UspA family protein
MNDADSRHILVAVDGSTNSRRAVEHVAEILSGAACESGAQNFRITLLHVIVMPDPDYFANDPAKRGEWLAAQRSEANGYLDEYDGVLRGALGPDARVGREIRELSCPSVAECILDQGQRLGAGVLVLGRQGRGAREELLLGSVSKRVVHNSRGRAVWVVT